jgi:hypothetical protein
MTPKHSWQILDSPFGITRAECKKCGIRRTTRLSNEKPLSHYFKTGKVYTSAPPCRTC